MTHPTTQILHDSLGTGFTRESDELLEYLDSFGAELGAIDDLVRDSDDGVGWSSVFDIDRATNAQLDFLAQFIGVRIPSGLTEEQRREYVEDAPGWGRGRPAAMKAEVAATLIGDKRISFVERAGSAYKLEVRTHPDDTPDPAAAEAAIRRQKPATIVLAYEASTALAIDSLQGSINDLVGNIDDLQPTWENA